MTGGDLHEANVVHPRVHPSPGAPQRKVRATPGYCHSERNRPHPTPIREGPAEQDRKKLYAPVSLRLFDEPAATLRLCNRLRRYLSTENAHIVLDLRRVDNFTSDALLLIHAVIVGTRARNANVSGNLPRDPRIASEFKEPDSSMGLWFLQKTFRPPRASCFKSPTPE